MNARECVRLALTCQQPERIPRALGFFRQSVAEVTPSDTDEYFNLDLRFIEFDPPEGQIDFLHYLRNLPKDIYVGRLPQLQTYHEWEYYPERGIDRPLNGVKSVEELIEFSFPDLTNPTRYADVADQVEMWHAQGLAVAGSPPHLGGELFETAWRLRGFQNFLIDLIEHEELAHYLLDQLTDMLIHNAVILAQAGVDIMLLDDDVATPTQMMISPALWRKFFKPRLANIIRLAREVNSDLLVFYHSDGNFTQILPDLIEIGVNIINPVQPDCMDAEAIKREFGDQLALWGTVGSAWTWDKGTPDDIRSEVQRNIETLGPNGLLLAPAYDIDFTPFQNIVAFVEAVDEFGNLK
jgi:uroporphyrinogen decarboxylase